MRRLFLYCKTCALLSAFLLLIPGYLAQGATRTASVTGNWSNTATWGGSAVPVAGDAVVVNSGITVTVDVAAVCTSITINAAAATNGITISGTNTLTVSAAITMNAASAGVVSSLNVGAGTLGAGSISIAGSSTSGRTTQLTISTGTVNCTGTITFTGTAAQAQFVFSGTGVLNIGGNFGTGGAFTPSTGTVNYNASAVQTIGLYTYNNLTLSGTSAKTFPTGTTTVNGVLSMEGTATATVTGTLTYGAAATLQYNTTTARSAGNEWKTPFTSTGGVIIANTGKITLNGAKVFNAGITLTINSGATLVTSNQALTFNGDFINNGTFTGGSSTVTITGANAQNIDDFTTTGAVSITKTSGTVNVTGNINAASLSLSTSSTGATALSLNPGIALTLTGTLTINRPNTGGTNTVDVGSSTITCGSVVLGGSTAGSRTSVLRLSTGLVDVSGNMTTAGAASLITFNGNGKINVGGTFMTSGTIGTFTPSTGTVNYDGSGAQSVIATTYYNLTFSNAGAKTFPAGTTTVNNILSIEGTASTVVTGTLSYGASATLQYKITDAHNPGSEWPATFTATGGVIIANPSGSVTLAIAKAFNASSSLTIGDGTSTSVFSDGGFQITSTGTLNLNSGTFKLGASNATTFPAFSSINITPGTMVSYEAGVSQVVSTVPVYSDLTLSGVSKTIGTANGATLSVNGTLVISPGATYLGTTYNPALNIKGDFTNSGTFTQGTGLVTFNGTAAQTINGTATFNNITIANTGDVVTSNVDFTVISPYILTINNGADFTFSGTTLTLGDDFINNGTFDPGSGTTEFIGVTAQVIGGISPTTFHNLTLNNANDLSITGAGSPTITGILTFTSGKITTGSNSIILGNSATISGAGPGKYIYGNLTKGIAASTSTKTFEIGDDSKYTPVLLNFSGTTTNSSGSITASTTTEDHPGIATSTIDPELSVNRYWTLTNNGVTFGTYSATFTFINPDDLDADANTANFIINRFSSSTWTSPAVGILASSSSQTTGLTSTGFGDFQLGELKAPRISIGSITDFGFQQVNTISTEKNYSVTGRNLIAPVVITPPAGFEISTTSGSGFITNPLSLSLTPSGGVVSSTIYVRFHPLAIQAYSGNITHTSTGAVQQNLVVTGTSIITYCSAASISYTQYESITNFNFGGINNTTPVVKTAGYFDYTQSVTAASVTQGISYPISVTEQFISTLDNGYCKVFIDFNQNGVFDVPGEVVFEGAYTGNMTFFGNATIPLTAMTGVTRLRVVVKGVGTSGDTDPCGTFTWGEVEDYSVNIVAFSGPGLFVTPNIIGFGYVASGGTSSEKTYSLQGLNLTPVSGNITVSAPTNFEVSLTSGSGFTTSLTLAYTGSSLSSTTIYARFKPTTANISYSSIVVNSGGGGAACPLTVLGTSLPYCASSGTTTTSKSIILVNFNTINNSTGKTAGYTDYYATQSTNVTIGNSYLFTAGINTAGNYRMHAWVWIDWNHNGSFLDAGEAYDLGSVNNLANGLPDLCPLSITIPAGAVTGNTRMRVSAKYNSDPTSCETGFDGEVEDYCVNVVPVFPNIYRSVATGNWNAIGTWEFSADNGLNWNPAIATPSSTDGTINIRNPHVVTLTQTITADQLTVEIGGTLVLSQNITIADGATTDMDVYGTLDCNSLIVSGAGSVSIESGAQLIMESPDGITASGSTGNIQTTTRTFNSGANYKYNGTSAQVTGNGLPAIVNNLTIENSAGVSLSGAVTINGTLTSTTGALSIGSTTLTFQNSNTPIIRTSGTITTSTGSNLIFGTAGNTGGNAFAIPSGTFTSAPAINNLTINRGNSITLNTQIMSIAGVLLCNGPLNTNGNLKLLSTAAQTALIDGTSTGSVTGNVTMQRYLSSGFGYKYFSSPFQSATVNEFADDLDLTASFPTFYRFNENLLSAGWVNYTNTTGTLVPAQGYAGNFGNSPAAKTVNMTGVVNNGTVGPVTLYNHNNTYTLGYNLAGNPYPSPIDWNAPSGWTKTNIDNALYYFNNGTTDQYTGTYSTYINGVSSDGIANNLIPSSQGFFVHVSDGTYPVTAQFGMNNNVRVNNLSPVFHKEMQAETRPILRLTAAFDAEGALTDPLVIYFDDTATFAFDRNRDALKLINTDLEVPNIYAISSDRTLLSISAIPNPADSLTVLPLGLKTLTDGWIKMKTASIERIPILLNVYLYDDQTKIYRNLAVNPEYGFYLHAGNCEGRFSIVFSLKELRYGSGNEGDFLVYSSENKIFVYANMAQGETGEISVYNILGQYLWHQKIIGNIVHELDPDFSNGGYIVEFTSQKGKQSKKVLITYP